MSEVLTVIEQPSSIKNFLKKASNVAFLAGGVAGAVSRTVVSPFERVKILLQVQSSTNSYNHGIFSSIRQVYCEEGPKGLFRGNGLNCIRIFPYSAVQFVVYEGCKKKVFHVDAYDGQEQLTNSQRLFSGALCGGCSVVATYPLDLIRTRLSIQTANLSGLSRSKAKSISKPPGIWKLLSETYRLEGGIKGLYRGVWPTSLGVVPYVALNFAVYEQLREISINSSGFEPSWKSNLYKLAIGAVSGGVAQTMTYPFDLLRRRFQVLAMGGNELGFKYSSVWDALVTIGKAEGFGGYYKGLSANLFKVVPSTAISWLVYEVACDSIRSW
ncbi:Mrx21p SKDI_16G2780 [Saccharomyces kudriavzevii IFO 1802]|uniref:Uncharacterized protein n=2 Tax=Saccharomyces kudriavzevii (strain ATCC MYA-4449 / AS 2.2408 / CBS 8840 / NBRC 1802 / NCYC 2889) TaxID=226230 RepID=A0AA35NNP6_SACK1|nr:uncharacterized protein SKDI_16G2780 [Saccharomyces kudriavzevii IFO 1802]EJT43347.1 YPR011C-like protein [Saccharomyces kudriavzevii IFO 1802]CAI4053686.1 hypothetical protein SKDI_16G2780 [Saccharomyces kudriavzevii IFO 1802]